MEFLHEINLARIWTLFVARRKSFFIAWGIAIVCALIIGFSIPRTYMSEVKLAPESAQSPLGGLSSIGSMMGLKLGDMEQNDAILPMLYPDVVESPDFLLDVLNIKVTTKDGSVKNVDYKTYLVKHTRAEWWKAFAAWCVRLVKPASNEKSIIQPKDQDGRQLIMLTPEDGQLLKNINGSILCEVDKKTDVISIKVIDQDPLVATILVDSISTRLQNFITDYRTKKARGEVRHLQKLYNKAYADYLAAQKKYASFADSHTGVVLNEYKVKEEDLENEVQLKYNVYSQLTVQLKAAEAKVLQRTPVYTTIQAAMVPYRHVAPKKSLIILMYLVLATFICFVWTYNQERKKEEKKASMPTKAEDAATE